MPVVASKSHHSCYFDAVRENTAKYGEKTVVLMMTGTFYEIYALRDNTTEEITGCNGLNEIMKITHLNYSEKQSAEFANKTIMQFGFRDYSIDKYLAIFNESGWTVAVYEQHAIEGEKHMERKLDRIFSPGTSFYTNEQSITNNIMCIWMKRTLMTTVNKSERCVFGMSSLDIFTGKCVVHEYDVQKYKHQTTSYDELERFYSVFRPNEVIFVYDGVSSEHVDDVVKYLNIGISTRRIQLDADDVLSKNVRKCEKQVYREEIARTYYDFVDYHEFCDSLMLNMYEFAFQSLCYLLAFTSEHNSNLTRHIKTPVLFTDNNHVILANHSLQQLNIIRDGTNTRNGVLSSVANFITSKTATDMGSRELKSNLLNPTTDENFLNNEYNITNYIVERNTHDDVFSGLRTHVLSKTSDIEKIYRRLLLNDAVPSTIKTLYDDLMRIEDYSETHLTACSDLDEYLQYKHDIGVADACSALLKMTNYIAMNLKINACTSGSKKIEENIFVEGVNLELDAVHLSKTDAYAKLNGIKKELEKLIETADSKTKSKSKKKAEDDEDSGLIVIHQTEKLPLNLKLTARRAKLLEDSLKNSAVATNVSINAFQFSFATASQSGKFIHHPVINQLAIDINVYEAKLVALINEQFKQFIGQLTEMFVAEFDCVINYVAALDLATTKAYIATKYNYCCPDIDADSEKAFVDAKELRHVLIEHLQTNEIYVPNDVCLGREKDGILLFGTNSVGKSSLIKSIGISLVMAQAGLFVPATEFKFKPYKMIMTRILGNDNIFKGLSTFIVEMTELKTILTMATKDSLVLGDEVCSGTESVSAISIFASALIKLHAIQSTFIFATHFHEVVKLDAIKALDRMMLKHMKVAYNAETDALEYVRVMCDGVGDTNYGLEVCRSLNMPMDFLDVAYDMRKIVAPETKSLLDSDGSRYNAGKIKHKCEMCGENADEVHHLQEQHAADSRGFIGTFNKNHKANLMSVCEKCHDKIHSTNPNKKVVKKVKTTKGQILSA
jgi:DNA mismatch repair protein MutS